MFNWVDFGVASSVVIVFLLIIGLGPVRKAILKRKGKAVSKCSSCPVERRAVRGLKDYKRQKDRERKELNKNKP